MDNLDRLVCNCARCEREIDCGTKFDPYPARRVNGRPYCLICFHKVTRGDSEDDKRTRQALSLLEDSDRNRVVRNDITDEDNWYKNL